MPNIQYKRLKEGRKPLPSELAIGEFALDFHQHCIWTKDYDDVVFKICSTSDRTVYSKGEYKDSNTPSGYKLKVNNITEWKTQGSQRDLTTTEYDYDANNGAGGWVTNTVTLKVEPTTYKAPLTVMDIKMDLTDDDCFYLLKTNSTEVFFNDTKTHGTTLKSGAGYGLIGINFKQKILQIATYESGWKWVYSSEGIPFYNINELKLAATHLSLDIDIDVIKAASEFRDVNLTKDNIKALKELQ